MVLKGTSGGHPVYLPAQGRITPIQTIPHKCVSILFLKLYQSALLYIGILHSHVQGILLQNNTSTLTCHRSSRKTRAVSVPLLQEFLKYTQETQRRGASPLWQAKKTPIVLIISSATKFIYHLFADGSQIHLCFTSVTFGLNWILAQHACLPLTPAQDGYTSHAFGIPPSFSSS